MIRRLLLYCLRALLTRMQLDLFALKPGIAYPENAGFLQSMRADIESLRRTISLVEQCR